MALNIPFDPVRSDLVPVGALDLDDDQHLLAIIGDNCQVNSPSAARHEPPSAFPESGCIRQIGQERGLDGVVKCPPFREPLNRHVMLLETGRCAARRSSAGHSAVQWWSGCASAPGGAYSSCSVPTVKPVVPRIFIQCGWRPG